MAKGKRGIIILVVAVLLAGLIYGSIKYTATAKFCGSCKNTMGPVYKTWAASRHSSEKNPEIKHHHECMACHSDPGLIGYIKAKSAGMLSVYYQLAGKYHLPLEGHKPVHCARPECHPKMTEIKEEKILINHPEHTKLMKEKFECIPCHKGVAHGGPDDPLHRPTHPDHTVCSECHKEIKNCELCHKDYRKMDLTLHCTRSECHANMGILKGKEKKIKTDHSKHVKTLGDKCAPCHQGHLKQGYKRVGDHKVCGTKKCHARAVEEKTCDYSFCHK